MDVSALRVAISKIPPVTRFLTGSSLAVSLPVMLHLLPVFNVLYGWNLVYRHMEVWRIWTSFSFGGTGISFLFNFIMLYRTSDALESHHYTQRSADYAWQLMVASVGLLGLNQPLGTSILHHPLLLTLIYLSSRLSPHMPYSLFGLVTIPAMWWPYVLLVLDGMMGGPQMLVQSLTGVIVGHAWWLLIWRDTAVQHPRLAQAPEWLKRLLPSSPVATASASGPQPRGFGATRGVAAVRQPAGYQWGAGQRLGD